MEICDGVLSITPGNELAPTERHSLHEAETSLEPSDDRLFVFRMRLKGARKRAQLTFQAANDFDRRQWVRLVMVVAGCHRLSASPGSLASLAARISTRTRSLFSCAAGSVKQRQRQGHTSESGGRVQRASVADSR